jgi:hypothetical protein
MDLEETTRLLRDNQLMVEDVQIEGGELLR